MTCCPDHDALVAAGCNICGTCKQRSYPVDAGWVAGRLVLATFEQAHAPGCTNRHMASTVLIDLGADDATLPRVPRPRSCRATAVTTGKPCKSPASPGSAWCRWHDPDRQAAR